MKKRIFSLCLLCACSVAAGQGVVNFFNNPMTLISGYNGGPTAPAGAYYFALLTAPVGTTEPWQFKFAGCYATNQTVGGRISGGWGVQVNDWAPGTAKAFLVCGWPAWVGHEWNQSWLLSGGSPLGVSMIASGIAGGGGQSIPPLNLFGSTTISSGFMVWSCLGPYWEGIFMPPANQTVVVGGSAEFAVRAEACPVPLYQWYFNGAPILHATDASYEVTNAQPADAGTYSVGLSNPLWPECCRTQGVSATLTVLAQPVIDLQPQSQTAFVGSTVHFGVQANGPVSGEPPLDIQWFFNGAISIPGGTNAILELSGVQLNQSGAYTVVIKNAFGAVTSAPTLLDVIVPVERRTVPGISFRAQAGTTVKLTYVDELEPEPVWLVLEAFTLAGGPQFYFDLSQPLPPGRLYRVSQAAPSAAQPLAEAGMFPALKLTGAVGTSVRVDYINQFGPTDAWVALDTVTVTNASQLFFDTTAIGQAPRLWRIVPVP